MCCCTSPWHHCSYHKLGQAIYITERRMRERDLEEEERERVQVQESAGTRRSRRFQEVKKQSAALQQFLPRRAQIPEYKLLATQTTPKGRVLLPGVPLRGVGNRVSALSRSPRRPRRI
ncbi:hypothetical protein DPX16_6944 [Anabarilius grahami]|uniref:Uncharacterized protein n=1 Tax=Anabarilius grahami TaxID=495550 RepID=A0A3N0Y5Q9_ANAGA|nr:hypothetical protein DPX16_6944 [Anabarilius grahami]